MALGMSASQGHSGEGQAAQQPAPAMDTATRAPIEIGWVLVGPIEGRDVAAARAAIELVSARLREGLPEFAWRVVLVQRREVALMQPVDPVALLDIGVLERDAAHWDFAFVVCDAPLRPMDKPFMLGAPSQAVDVAVLSTARLDPAADADQMGGPAHQARFAGRLAALVLHLFGHLNDVPHPEADVDGQAAEAGFMTPPRRVEDLDRMVGYSQAGWARLRARLADVADPRIEEASGIRNPLRFFWAALWRNRGEVASGVRRIAPWQFPFRYSRLTTAAMSTLLLLIITAEAWELGMSQPGTRVVVLSLLALLGTSSYVSRRQHMLSRFGTHLTEQSVTTATAVGLGVLLGMATTYVLLFATTWLAATTLFGTELVHHWTVSIPVVRPHHYLTLSGFVASLGLLIGALGASFEQESYFRRVTMLDEET